MTMPRWWQSRKGMTAVVLTMGYVVGMLMRVQMPEQAHELVRIVIVALFLTANGEHKP